MLMKNAVRLLSLLLMLSLSSGCQTLTTDDVDNTQPTTSVETTEVAKAKEEPSEPAYWADDAVIYEVNLRQYTEEGTISAFMEHLPRLQELGVEILWFMPIHPISEVKRKGTLGSYYAVANYKAVNPEFGTMEDFETLVATAHEMGFKVILDWVPNHTGWDHVWITEHPDWYTQVDSEIVHPIGTDWTDVADLNYENSEMRAAMIDAMAFWVSEQDVDGFRCDVAGSVPVDFWEEASAELKSIKDVYMLAEDGSNFQLLMGAFDSNYNWSLMNSMNQSATGKSSANTLKSDLVRIIPIYPEGTYPMNFITNHDENSWNGTTFERLGGTKELMEALTFVAPGMPLIYSGQEASLDDRLAFFEKDEIDWSDLSHQENLEKLVDLKQENPALHNGLAGGDLNIINTTDKHILALIRIKGDNKVIYMANIKEDALDFKLKAFEGGGAFSDYVTGYTTEIVEGSEWTLEGYEYRIFIAE